MNEHKCKTCGADLVWVGNVLDGYMRCDNCAHQPALEEIDANIKALNNIAALKDEEDDGLMLTTGRRPGKTYGMVLRALEMASKGHGVVILTHNHPMVKYVSTMLCDLGVVNGVGGTITFRVPGNANAAQDGSLKVLSIGAVSPRGLRRDTKVFADHMLLTGEYEALEVWRLRYEILT